MKKVFLVGTMFLMFMGVVSASSINGDYKGNPVVKLMLDGQEIPADDVPAMIYDNRTVVPIYLLKKMGATVTWDLDKYSADIKLPTAQAQPIKDAQLSIFDMTKNLKKDGVTLINYMTNGDNINKVTFYTNYSSVDGDSKNSEFSEILKNGVLTDADLIEVYYTDNNIFSVPSGAMKDFFDGKIDGATLQKYYKFETSTDNSLTSSKETQSGANTQNQSAQPTNTPAPITSTDAVHAQICKSITDKYNSDLAAYKEGANPFSGQYDYYLTNLARNRDNSLSANGCN